MKEHFVSSRAAISDMCRGYAGTHRDDSCEFNLYAGTGLRPREPGDRDMREVPRAARRPVKVSGGAIMRTLSRRYVFGPLLAGLVLVVACGSPQATQAPASGPGQTAASIEANPN